MIPTYHRADLVCRAVASALAQTVAEIEVIVVVDGRDDATITALHSLSDSRLIVHVPRRRLGNADARNAGVALARGEWVAFLDDDDEWLPHKLEVQLRAAEANRRSNPIVSCRLIARDEDRDRIWPRRLPRTDEPLSEYFFCRTSPFTGEGMVINSGILTTRELAVMVPFRSGLERHVDPDWMLRAARGPGASLIFVPESEPLVIWHVERRRRRITTQPDWKQSLDFCMRNRDLFSQRGYAAFVLHVVGSNAAAQGCYGAFPLLLREAFSNGRPSGVDLVSHFGNFVLPFNIQRALAGLYDRYSSPRRLVEAAARTTTAA